MEREIPSPPVDKPIISEEILDKSLIIKPEFEWVTDMFMLYPRLYEDKAICREICTFRCDGCWDKAGDITACWWNGKDALCDNCKTIKVKTGSIPCSSR